MRYADHRSVNVMRRFVAIAAVLACLVVPAVAFAHAGHAHKVMGTVSSIDGNHIVLKTPDGKTATVMVDAKTKITQGKTSLTASALKVGDRLVAEGAEDKGMITATTVRVGQA